MDFQDSPDETAWRARCRTFLDSVAERRRPGHVRGYRRGEDVPGVVEKARVFQRQKWEAGFAGISWPKEWHGQGGTAIQQMIYDHE